MWVFNRVQGEVLERDKEIPQDKHGKMAVTWKLPWWDSKSPGKLNLGSGTMGMRSF